MTNNTEEKHHPSKGRISIRDTARIAQEFHIRIEIERDGTIYRFEPLTKKRKRISDSFEKCEL